MKNILYLNIKLEEQDSNLGVDLFFRQRNSGLRAKLDYYDKQLKYNKTTPSDRPNTYTRTHGKMLMEWEPEL